MEETETVDEQPDQLAAKDAEIERLTKERNDWKTLFQWLACGPIIFTIPKDGSTPFVTPSENEPPGAWPSRHYVMPEECASTFRAEHERRQSMGRELRSNKSLQGRK